MNLKDIKQMVERESTSGNAAKLREVLDWATTTIDVSEETLEETEDWETEVVAWVKELQRRANAALAAPPRNCDVGTAMEQEERYNEFCGSYKLTHGNCFGCPALRMKGRCEFAWAQMPYEAQKGGK